MSGVVRVPAEKRFWDRVDKSAGDDGCWVWTGNSRDKKGYGGFSVRNTRIRAHRFSWVLAHGAIPDGLCVCHRCDNPGCVNPSHLFLGTNAENVADREAKGRRRAPVGELNPAAKLNELDVQVIREAVSAGEKQRRLAEKFNVSPSTVWLIVHGKKWQHLRVQS